MSYFDINNLSREELDQITHLIQKKTAALENNPNYVPNNDHTMKFIEGIAMKSDSRESFWKRLHRKLDSPPSSSSSTISDQDLLSWFLNNQAKLQALASKLSLRGSQNPLTVKLTEALNIASHSQNINNLNGSKLGFLRDLHFSISNRNTSNTNINVNPNNNGNINGNSSNNNNGNKSSNNSQFNGPPGNSGPPGSGPHSGPHSTMWGTGPPPPRASYSPPNAPGGGPPVRRTSPPAPTGHYNGPNRGPGPPIVKPLVDDDEDNERMTMESLWIADIYVKIHQLLRLITELNYPITSVNATAADKSRSPIEGELIESNCRHNLYATSVYGEQSTIRYAVISQVRTRSMRSV